MTLRHLRIFLAVCETGMVTAAAEKLYMAQPAVSLAIGELERHYGTKLFQRISRRLHITEQGEQLRQYALHIVGLSDEAEKRLTSGGVANRMRVGGSIALGGTRLPPLVKQFQEQNPHILVTVSVDTSPKIEGAVLSNQLDIAIVEQKVDSPYLVATPLCRDQLVFLCHPDHPFSGRNDVRLSELASQPLLLREPSSASCSCLMAQLSVLEQRLTPQWVSASNTALLSATAHGLGVSYLPQRLAQRPLERGVIATFSVEKLTNHRQVTLIYHKNKLLTPEMTTFIDACNQMFSL